MAKSEWTQIRLQRLFDRYNRLYWEGRIPRFTVLARALRGGFLGSCHSAKRRIDINVKAHASDGGIRETMLHEMAHAADRSRKGPSHGIGFWAQIEHLLRCGAPIDPGGSEMPGIALSASSIPKRFPLSRKAVSKAAARSLRPFQHLQLGVVRDEEILGTFEAAGMQGLSWKGALAGIGSQYSFLGIAGKPVSRKASSLIRQGEVAFREGRRLRHEERRIDAVFNAAKAAGRTVTRTIEVT